MTKRSRLRGCLPVFTVIVAFCAVAVGVESARPAWQAEKTEGNPVFTADATCLFPNSDFEAGDWSHWNIVSGAAWIVRPGGCLAAPSNDGVFGVPDLAGGYCTACSDNTPSGVGVIASQPFTITRKYIAFFTTGWDGKESPPPPAQSKNKVELIRAQDNAVLFTANAPFRSTWGVERWDVSNHQGASVYLKITDANPDPNNGWFGVCQFYGSDSDWEDLAVRTPGLLHDALGVALPGHDRRYLDVLFRRILQQHQANHATTPGWGFEHGLGALGSMRAPPHPVRRAGRVR